MPYRVVTVAVGPNMNEEMGSRGMVGRSQVLLRRLSFFLKAAGNRRQALNRGVTWSDVHFKGIIQATEWRMGAPRKTRM